MKKINIFHNFIEISCLIFQLCCLSVPRVEWVHGSNGSIPPGAVAVGRTATGEPLYAGRVHHHGTLTVGKVRLYACKQN